MTKEHIVHLLGELNEEQDLLKMDNESRDGKLFSTIFFYEARYVIERKCWYVFDGIKWREDVGSLAVMEKCKQLGDCMVEYAVNRNKSSSDKYGYKYLTQASKWYKRKFRETVIRDAASVSPLSISEFDSAPYLVNFQNGTLDLQTGTFNPHNSLDFLTKCMNCNYVQGLSDARYLRFIDEIMSGDGKRAEYLQKALGYALGGTNEQECLFILYGATTRNGKSTLMESVLGVLGDYARAANPETIASKATSSSAPSEDVARLKGARLVNISEPPQSLVLNAARVKTMTGSDTLNARFLHENSFDFKPQFKMYINTNYLPVINDTTLFASERIHIIPFERHFEEHEQDKHLKEYFAKDEVRNAIGMWLVEGYFMYFANGLTPPDSVKKATSDYEAESDRIKQFIDERLTYELGAATPTSVVYREYRNWCIGSGAQPLAQNKFSERLKRYGEIKRKRVHNNVLRCLYNYYVTDVAN